MKKFILLFFLAGFCNVFASFEFDILGQVTASISFPMLITNGPSYTKSSAAANFGVALQIGNQYSIRKVINDKPMEAPIMNSMSIGNQSRPKELKAVSVLFDLRIEQETIALGNNSITVLTNSNIELNMARVVGLNLGAGITTKFIIGSVNSLVPRDTILGFSLGAKLLVNLFGVDAALLGIGGIRPVVTPYIDLFVEQRFFVARKFALVGGINIGADIMIAFLNEDLGRFFNKYNVTPIYPSLNIGVSLGMHFGN